MTSLDLSEHFEVADPPAEPAASGASEQADPQPADPVLAGSIELARAAAGDVGGDTVGEHTGVHGEANRADGRVVTHTFAATLPGYVGWQWAVTLARPDDVDDADADVTVDEVVLLPGTGALIAPAWVPWHERVRPGDLSPGELLPAHEDDVRLVPAYTDSGDPGLEAMAFELGLGRERVLSRDGRELAAERWYEGDHGPDTAMARQAPGTCGTCGFLVGLVGALSAGFGVCANELVDTDGAVVSVEFGCGAHSQAPAPQPVLADAPEIAYDDGEEITAGR